ncbi:MAG: LysR family transcriptional regulator [Gammaproteobacteria bacterium]
MENWDDYRFVLALDRAGTLRGAAQRLGVNHSTVSRRLQAINQAAAGPLFEKIVGGYRPTSHGDRVIESAEQMELIVIASQRQRRAEAVDLSGEVKLSVPDTLYRFLLLSELAKFQREYPAIDLVVGPSNRLVNLDRSEADVVVRGTKQPPDHLVGRRLFPYALCYYSHVDYLKDNMESDYAWIGGADNSVRKTLLAKSPFPDAPVGLKINDVIMRHEAALEKHGMIIDACYMADPDPRLSRLPGARAFSGLDLWVLTHPDLRDTPRIQCVMQFLVDVLRKNRELIEGRSN